MCEAVVISPGKPEARSCTPWYKSFVLILYVALGTHGLYSVDGIGDYSKDFNQKSNVIRFMFQKNH